MKVSRRSLLHGAGALAGAAALTPGLVRRSSAQAKEIIYWGHNFPSRVRIVNEIMVPGFKKETGLTVVHNDFETNQHEVKILAGWSGGKGGPDIVSVGDHNMANYVYRKLVAPVDPNAFGFKTQDELVAAFEPGAVDAFIVDGKLYGIPMNSHAISMYYRKDLFKEAGLDPDKPPKTWDEVTEFGKVLTKKDGNGRVTRAGWAWEARSASSHFYYWGTLLPQQGADFLNADGTKNGLNNAGGLKALQYVWDTFHKDKISALGLAPTISPIDDFGTGLAAMLNAGAWLAPELERKYPSVNYKDGVYGVARLPQFDLAKPVTRLNPWIFMVSANSQVQREAWDFIAYMTQGQQNRDIWLEQAKYILPWKGLAETPLFKALPYGDVVLEDMRIAVPTPRTPKVNQLAGMAAKAYDRISANGDAPEPVLNELSRSIDRLVAS